MGKTKQKGNGEGTIFYNEKRKCWTFQKTLGIKKDDKYYRATTTGSTKNEAKENMVELQNNLIKDSNVLKQLKSLILTPELKNQLQFSTNPKILAELNNKTINVDLLKAQTSSAQKLSEILFDIENEKLNSNIINENTYSRNICTINHIKDSSIDIPIIEIDQIKIQLFLNSKKYLSQSYLKKIINILNYAFEKYINDEIITKNPLKFILKPVSDKETKEVIAFEIWEQTELINYILSNNLIYNNKSNYNSDTIKNIILLGLFTGMRLGEIGSINYKKDIDFQNECFKIKTTLTKNIDGKTVIGKNTKTGKKKLQKGESDIKLIQFNVFNKEFIKSILMEQINIAKNNSKNINNLLFCDKNGNCIVESSVNNLFKRICRDAGIKLELPKGCHTHMLRHTFTTRCIEAGLSLMTIAKLLGHSTTKQIEQTYGHILDKFRNQELQQLNNYYKQENIVIFPTANISNF